jgi:4-amino-4-deoxy-L-arabinose transferase-like glycosyltransferase
MSAAEPLYPADAGARWLLWGMVLLKLLLHLSLANRFDFHGDEYYFVECGQHPAFGYVDHPPFVPLVAVAFHWLDADAVWPLRIPAALAGAATVGLIMCAARLLGGGLAAQAFAGLAALIAPAYLAMSGMLNIPVFEQVFWSGLGILLIKRIQTGDPRWWLGLGLVAGLALMNKHTTLFWGAGVVVGVLFTPLRRDLVTPWPYAGGALALLIFLPNLVWQMQHDWATLEFIRNMEAGTLARESRLLFVLGQLLYMHPLNFLFVGAAFYFLFFKDQGKPYRIFGWIYLTVLVILLLRQGKPYYLCPAYPMLFAAGAVQFERVTAARRFWRPVCAAAMVLLTLALAPAALPLLPMQTMDRYVGWLLGGAIPPEALTGDFHRQHFYRGFVDQMADIHAALPEADRAHCVILAGNYSKASAINILGPAQGLPRAYSGFMTHYYWGPPQPEPEVLLATGLPRERLVALYAEVAEVGRTQDPLAPSYENDRPIYLCRKPLRPLSGAWAQFKNFGG